MDQDLDSLDSLLFKTSDKQDQKSKIKPSSFDFDEDDPLKDLFSDEEDVDHNTSKESVNKKELPKDKNKIISSLFNIPESKNSKSDSDDWLGLKVNIESEPKQSSDFSIKPKIDEKNSPIHKTSSSNILIATTPKKEIYDNPAKIPMPSKPEKVVKFITSEEKKKSVLDDLFGDSDNKQSKGIIKSESNEGYVASLSKEMKKPSSRRNSLVFGDSIDSNPTIKPIESEKMKKIDSLSSYSPSFITESRNSRRNSFTGDLLDSLPSKTGSSRKNNLDDDFPGSNLPNWLGGSSKKNQPSQKVSEKQEIQKPIDTKKEDISLTKVIGDSNQIESQMSASLLRQEGQLLAALQLKRHTEQMAVLEKRQQEMILRQEKQLDELLKNQVQRQQDLEAKMQIQQEQIHSHIQALLSTPSNNILSSSIDIVEQSSENIKTFSDRKTFESSMENISYQHKQEMELIENSYKKQITILENMLKNVETRLREECEFIEKEYKDRINKVEQHYEYILDSQKSKLNLILNEKDEELNHLKECHQENLKIVQEQHMLIIDHFRKANLLEHDVIKETTSNVQRFDNLISQMNQNYQDISTIKDDLDSRHMIELENKDKTIQIKDMEIQKLILKLENQTESFSKERQSLNEKISQLDYQVIEKNMELKSENWKLNQELSKINILKEELENEKKQIIKNFELQRAEFENQQKISKEEQERISKHLEEEKIAITAERARLDAYARLHGPNGDVLNNETLAIKQAKAEIEATLQVAEEATKAANEERELLLKERKTITIEKKRLEELEKNLKMKSKEIEFLMKEAKEVKEKGQFSLEEAKKMELTQIDRSAYISKQLEILSEREKTFLKEKAEWSKIKNPLETNNNQKLCGYCKRSLDRPYVTPQTFNSLGIKEFHLDPQEVIQKLVAESEHFDPEDNSKFLTSFQTASK